MAEESTFIVYLWPDGTYCEQDLLEEYLACGWSDDYEAVKVPYDIQDLDAYILNHVRGNNEKLGDATGCIYCKTLLQCDEGINKACWDCVESHDADIRQVMRGKRI